MAGRACKLSEKDWRKAKESIDVFSVVTEIISKRGQEPYVAFKLNSLMQNAMFDLTYFENKDVFLGKLL
jgi:hypothetical protein